MVSSTTRSNASTETAAYTYAWRDAAHMLANGGSLERCKLTPAPYSAGLILLGPALRRVRKVGLVGAALCVSSAAAVATDLQPNVVVTIKPIHALVSGIMQGVATPTLIVDGSASPHTFTLKPSAAKAINTADVFVRVSEAVEPFTRKIVKALPKSVTVVTAVDVPGLKLLDQRAGDTFDSHSHGDHAKGHNHDHDHDHGKAHDDSGETATKDGHVWLDPGNAKMIVANIAGTLAERFPQSAEKFRANAASLATQIDSLTAEIDSELTPVKGKPFVVFHDATQYFEQRFSVPAVGSVTVSPDVQPSAKRLTAVRKKIANLSAVCVFAEPSFQPKLIDAVTEGTKARSGTLDAEGAALTVGPSLYFDLMRGLSRNLKSCLAPSA